jgi:hypothetical protein
MTEHEKTVCVPDDFTPRHETAPLIAVVVHGEADRRDVSKPIGYDANGKPLYASHGFRLRW